MPGNFRDAPAELASDVATVGGQSLERIKQSTHAVIREMRRAGRLSGSARGGHRGRIRRLSRRGMRTQRSFHRRAGRYFTRGPGTQNFESLRRSSIRAVTREKRKNALGAVRRPTRERRVACAVKRTAAMHRHKSSIPAAHLHSCLGYRRAYSGRICG